jgi:hypothetical protein
MSWHGARSIEFFYQRPGPADRAPRSQSPRILIADLEAWKPRWPTIPTKVVSVAVPESIRDS